MDSPQLITLTTDFGVTDTYVGQMKGVILGINPQARIVDMTHSVEAQNVLQGAYVLDEFLDAFPPGTIHLAIVDPGVGSARKRIGAEIGNQRFVGPDNGLLTLICKRYPVHRVHELTVARFHRPAVSSTFHGRDIFAPVAAHWSLGTDLSQFGPSLEHPLCQIPLLEPRLSDRSIEGQIIAVDHFGNLISNISEHQLPIPRPAMTTTLAGRTIRGISRFYAEHPPGEVLVLVSSSGRIEVAQNQGRAGETLRCGTGTSVRIDW